MMSEQNRLENVVGWKAIMSFALPSIATMVFISSYSIVDGAIVSTLIGTNALASVNILVPLATIFTGLGFMLSSGGSAYVATLLGKGESKRASDSFTTIVFFSICLSIVMIAVGLPLISHIVMLLGADETLIQDSIDYGRTFLFFSPFFITQFIFMQMLIVAGKPKISLILSVSSGLTNLILDIVFIEVFGLGLIGAAIASGCGSMIPSVIGGLLFLRKDMSVHFTKPIWGTNVITSSCTNGVSEMASELTVGITTLLYNIVMMTYIGADGVSAITILMHLQFFSAAVTIGYSNGVAPLMSYNYGKQDKGRMRALYATSMVFILTMSVLIFLFMMTNGEFLIGFYANFSPSVMEIATRGSTIFSFAFLVMGVNIYASSLFTSLSNGLVSALISIIRSLLLLAPLIVLLPYLFGIDALWYSVPLTEYITLCLSLFLMLRLGKGYGFISGSRRHRS